MLRACLALLAVAGPAFAQVPDVTFDRRVPFATRNIIEIALDADDAVVWTGDRAVPRADTVPGSIVQLGGSLLLEGRVTGNVTTVASAVTIRPGARVEGRVTVLGGTLYGTGMAQIAGPLDWLREEPVRVVEAAPGRVLVDYEPPPEPPFPIELKGFAGITVHEYNGVDGLLFGLTAGLRKRPGQPRTELAGGPVFRTARSDVGWNVRFLREFPRARGLTVGGRVYRITETPERWHRGAFNNSLAALFLADDDRTYHERTGGELWAERSFGLPFTVRIQGRVDVFDSLPSRRPFAFFGDDEDWRTNPAAEEGTGAAIGAKLTIDRRNVPDFATRGVFAEVEVNHWGLGGDFAFDWAQGEALVFVPLGGASFVGLRGVAGGRLGAGDTLAPQFLYRLGGGGSIPGYRFGGADTLSPGSSQFDILTGDRMAFATATVHIGIPVGFRVFRTVYLVGIGSLGDAWVEDDGPDWNAAYGGGIAGRGQTRYVGVFGVYGAEIDEWRVYFRLSPWF
jgi:hypothetical protein